MKCKLHALIMEHLNLFQCDFHKLSQHVCDKCIVGTELFNAEKLTRYLNLFRYQDLKISSCFIVVFNLCVIKSNIQTIYLNFHMRDIFSTSMQI